MKGSQLAIDEYCDTFCGEALDQFCQFPFPTLSGFSPWSPKLLLARWQWWFRSGIIPSHCILAHTRDHMDGYPKHPVDEWRFGEVGISYYTHWFMSQHHRELSNGGTDSIPECHCLSSAIGIHNESNGIDIARDQVGQYGEAHRSPLSTYECCTQQTSKSPVMAYQVLSPMWIATVIMPFLHSRHLPFNLGNQRGIHPCQICSIDKKLVLKSLFEQRHKAKSHIINVPLILRQKAFPTGDMSAHKEASFGNVCHAFTGLSQEQKCQHESPEVDEIVGSESRSKRANIVYNSHRKERIHRFSFLVESFLRKYKRRKQGGRRRD